MPDSEDNRLYQNIKIAFAVIALLWAVHLLNFIVPVDFRFYGLRPRNTDRLLGIVYYPFLHGSFKHLTGNSGTLFVLLVVSLSLNRKMTGAALAIITGAGGAGVWIFGSPGTVHIGASGVIFGLIGFLLFIGIFRRQWKPLIFSLAVFFAYGGALAALLVYAPGVSWSGHFWGFVSGVAAAWYLRDMGKEKNNSLSDYEL